MQALVTLQGEGAEAAAAAALLAVKDLRQKAEKWKMRCHELKRELVVAASAAAAREASLMVRPHVRLGTSHIASLMVKSNALGMVTISVMNEKPQFVAH